MRFLLASDKIPVWNCGNWLSTPQESNSLMISVVVLQEFKLFCQFHSQITRMDGWILLGTWWCWCTFTHGSTTCRCYKTDPCKMLKLIDYHIEYGYQAPAKLPYTDCYQGVVLWGNMSQDVLDVDGVGVGGASTVSPVSRYPPVPLIVTNGWVLLGSTCNTCKMCLVTNNINLCSWERFFKLCIHFCTSGLKGTSQDFIFQMSLFSTLADIFAYLETPPMY